MATMHPSTFPVGNHPQSERMFYEACRDQLSSKYHVFYSLRWFTTNNGRREDSECDFLIFNPDYGFLCIEVKGGSGIRVEGDGQWFLDDDSDPNGGRFLKRSPYQQAEQSMRYFKNYFEEELEMRYPGAYGCAAAFPRYIIPAPLTVDSPLEITIDMSSMSSLAKRIVEIFRYFNSSRGGHTVFFSPDSQRKFIELINKRIALSICAGALIQDKERELVEINKIQDTVIDLLSHYPRAFIIGGAGTGKTWIGIKKVKRCVASGGRALYLCYNKTLAETFEKNINNPNANCMTIDMLAQAVLGEKANQCRIVNGVHEYSEAFAEEGSILQYDLVVVDEAQDFTEDWAFCANLVLKDGGSLYVFYDESQNIFERSFGERFMIDTPPFVLRYNIRNTADIYTYTKENTNMGLDTIANQVEGVAPECRKFTRRPQVVSFVDSTINKLVNKEGVEPSKIMIIGNVSYEQSVLSKTSIVGGCSLMLDMDNKNGIRYKTVEEFKGLESDVVIFINHTYPNEPQTNLKRAMLYTAMTRARFYLYIIDYVREIQ